MLLAVDIGNSNVKFGVYKRDQLIHHWRVLTVREQTADEYGVYIRSFFAEAGLERKMFTGAIVSSVVPQLTAGIIETVTERTGCLPLVVSPEIELGLEIRTDRPTQLGADLIANAVGGWHQYHESCIVVSFGSATVLIAVAAPGAILGTVIAAGQEVTSDALVSKAAQLAYVPMQPPPSIIGTNTTHSMQAGLLVGHIAMVEGLVDRMRAEMGPARVIATGGLVETLASVTNYFDAVNPWLTLDGLRIIASFNQDPRGN